MKQVQGCHCARGILLHPHLDTVALGPWTATNAGEITWNCCLCKLQPLFQVMQVAYGLATSTEVAYFTYIYAKISGEHYRLVRNLKIIWNG